jgi:cytochrome c-type biogenesis protein CcmE
MKALQKMILPALLLAAILLIYFMYFAPTGELGLYSNFDTNNNANKDIRVSVVQEKGIKSDPQNHNVTFFAVDGEGVENLVQAPFPLPEGVESSDVIILKGHLHEDHFHAVEVNLP